MVAYIVYDLFAPISIIFLVIPCVSRESMFAYGHCWMCYLAWPPVCILVWNAGGDLMPWQVGLPLDDTAGPPQAMAEPQNRRTRSRGRWVSASPEDKLVMELDYRRWLGTWGPSPSAAGPKMPPCHAITAPKLQRENLFLRAPPSPWYARPRHPSVDIILILFSDRVKREEE